MAASNVLVVVAHPDDEVLLCGGTMAKHVLHGDRVNVLVMSEGVTSREGAGQREIEERQTACFKAANVLGYAVEIISGPDQRLDTLPRLTLVKEVEGRLEQLRPSVVYTHWHSDMNLDHRIVSEVAQTACRPHPGSTVKILLMGEVPSSTEWAGGFNPNWFIDVTDTMLVKIAALECYHDELRSFPHPRSIGGITTLAQYRGSTIGVRYAEAFELVRCIA